MDIGINYRDIGILIIKYNYKFIKFVFYFCIFYRVDIFLGYINEYVYFVFLRRFERDEKRDVCVYNLMNYVCLWDLFMS